MPPGVVDQNAAHGAGRGSKELAAILPLHPVQVRQLHVGLVHQAGRAERVVRPLALELAVGDAPQVVVDGGLQSVTGIGFAAAGLQQQFGDCFARGHPRAAGPLWEG